MRGTVPVVTETFVVHNSSDESFAKGKELFEKGAVSFLVQAHCTCSHSTRLISYLFR